MNGRQPEEAPQSSTARNLGTATRVASKVATPAGIAQAANAGVAAATAPLRRSLSNAVGDFATGFAGSAASAQAAAPKVNIITPNNSASMGAANRPPARHLSSPAAAPAGGQAPAAVSILPNSPTADAMPMPKPGDAQTFTGSNGVTRQLPSYAPAGGVQSQSFGGTATPMQRKLSQPVVAPDNPIRNMGPRVQGGVIPSAPGMEAGVYGGEAKRRLENDLITIGVGRPSVRRGLIEAYIQQHGAQNAVALADQNAGAAMDLQQQRGVMDANEAFAGRRLDASALNLKSALTQQQTEAKGQRVMRTLTDQAGNSNLLRADGSLTPLTGADGQPVQEQIGAGQVTPEVQYTALADQLKAITENPMLQADERQALIAPIQAQMAALANQGQQQKPTLDQFLDKARAANSGTTEEQLIAFYHQKYGAAR